MQSKTVTELRVLARTKGIKGYSRMCKDELIRALEQANSRRRKVASRAGKNKAKGKSAKAAEKRTVTKKTTAARL